MASDPTDTDEVRVLVNLPTKWPDPLGHIRLIVRLCDALDAARTRNEELRAVLLTHGGHYFDCYAASSHDPDRRHCSCGWSAVRAELEGPLDASS